MIKGKVLTAAIVMFLFVAAPHCVNAQTIDVEPIQQECSLPVADESDENTLYAKGTRMYRIAKTEGNRINVKLNSLVLIGIVNPAVEFKVLPKVTTQLEAFGSFYTTDFLGTGKPFVLGSGSLEFRYYPRAAFSGFFAAPNIGFGVYKLNKGIIPRFFDDYKGDCYQQGSNVMVGATIGYQWNINNHWSIEIAWGGGFHNSVYQGFKWNPDLVVDKNNGKVGGYEEYVGRNASSEWLPIYKGGIFVGYRF